MKGNIEIHCNEKGFTLTELLVAMAIGLIVMASIGYVYQTQQKSYFAQEQIAEMQQNLRAAMFYMERDIKMAGYDPTGNSGASIMIANTAELQFRVDENGDGNFSNPSPPPTNDSNEQLRYALTNDANKDGIADGSPCHLGRENWSGGLQTIAENIDALDFVYIDEGGNTTTTLSEIRSVQITIVARTGEGAQGFINNTTYSNQQGTPIYTAPGDNNRRMSLTTIIKCRNL